MNPKFLSNEELTSAFTEAKKAALAGERITSWSSAGTSVTKQLSRGAASTSAFANALAREIAFRKAEGRIPAETLPEIAARPRPRPESAGAFTA